MLPPQGSREKSSRSLARSLQVRRDGQPCDEKLLSLLEHPAVSVDIMPSWLRPLASLRLRSLFCLSHLSSSSRSSFACVLDTSSSLPSFSIISLPPPHVLHHLPSSSLRSSSPSSSSLSTPSLPSSSSFFYIVQNTWN